LFPNEIKVYSGLSGMLVHLSKTYTIAKMNPSFCLYLVVEK